MQRVTRFAGRCIHKIPAMTGLSKAGSFAYAEHCAGYANSVSFAAIEVVNVEQKHTAATERGWP